MTKAINDEFNPGLQHEYYFIRHCLLEGIRQNAPQLQGKLMDFGCGSKPYKSLFDHVKEYVGVDYDGEGHTHENEQIDVYYDGKTIPFADNTFDSVLCSEVFEHLFNLDDILKELNRVMKPGAKMLITCPFVWNIHEAPIDYARYTPYALKHNFEKNGFKVLTEERKGNFVQTIFQISTVYLLGSFFGSYTGKNYISTTFKWRIKNPIIFVHNCIGKVFSKLLPKRFDLYLINVFLVEKVN